MAPSANAPLQVEYRDIARLIPYARNARTHSDAQVAQIAASIREFGWTNPVLVDGDNGVIAGHGRLLAARKLGISNVPVIELAGLSDAARRAYILADNKLALNAGWDEAMLALEVGDLAEIGVDLSLTGFDEGELAALAAKAHGGLTDPDQAPEPPARAASRAGDIWRLGRHRLACGDSTDAAIVDAVLAGVRPHLMVTDPPYGVDYDPAWRADANKWKGSNVKIGGKALGKVSNDDRADWGRAWELFPGDVAYVWHGGLRSVEQAQSLEAAGFNIRSQIIWNKGRLVISRGDYHWQHEACWYAVRKGRPGRWSGSRTESTVWDIAKPSASETGHGTQKPVECMKRPIENNSSPGQAIYEPFSGSGTTIIAAEMTGRVCYAIELDPAYVDVAVERWQAFTGQEARLEADDATFEMIKRKRCVDEDATEAGA